MALVSNKAREAQYRHTLEEYVTRRNGLFVLLSDDQVFLTLLRLTLQKEVNADITGLLTLVPTPGHLLRVVSEACTEHEMPVLIVERVITGRDFSFMIQQLKNAYANLKVIVLTSGVEREQLMYLYEIGVDNIIMKPVSANTLLEKLAFTLKPQGKLGQFIDLARKRIKAGDPEGALQLCQQVLEIKPNSAAARLLKGDAHMALQQTDEARQAYVEASDYAELFLEPLRRLAELAGSTGEVQERLHYLQRLDELSPLNIDRKVDMGEIHLELGHAKEAESFFSTAVDQASKEAINRVSSVSTRIADIYVGQHPEEAEKYLRAGLERKQGHLSREDITIFNRLGISLRQQGRWEDALTEYTKALALSPDDENIYYNMGMACAEGKNFASACDYFIQALGLNAELPRSNHAIAYNMGVVFLQGHFKDRGIDCLHIALELYPGFEPAQHALERIDTFQGA